MHNNGQWPSENLFLCPFLFVGSAKTQKKTRNSRRKTRAMETHFYTIFFPPPLQFYYEHSEIFPTIFFSCPVSISRKMNGKKKNSKFEREDKSNGNPLLNHLIFFVPLQFSYENSETFPAVYFLCPVSICRIMNAKKKKKTQNSSQKTRDHWFFFFSFTTFSLLFIFLVVTKSLRWLYLCGDLIIAAT